MSNKKDGFHTEYHSNGQKESEGCYKDGRREGWWTEWHENGQKREEGNYQKVKTGSWRWMFERKPRYGKREGQYISWHDNSPILEFCVESII